MTDDELLSALNDLRTLMINVATGGPRINDVNGDYQRVFASVAADLARRRIDNPITFGSLWDWYARWSSGDLPTYQSRRNFISELINPLLNRIRTGRADEQQPTGWQRVDRCVGELRDRLAAARNEEQFQTVGLLGREALISLAQGVFDRARHPPLDNVEPGPTDAKRMLDAYIAVELGGGSVPTLSASLFASCSNSYVGAGSGLAPPRDCDGRPGHLTRFHLQDWIVSLNSHR